MILDHATRPIRPMTATEATVRAVLPLVAVVAIALALHALGAISGQYMTRIGIDCGIAIIAAVSLTIVNGFTGQFSIGHAAFMALGGYAGGMLTYYWFLGQMNPDQILATVKPTLVGAPQWVLLAACAVGAMVSALAGWLVGLPSLRLRGDYLAIVTLGFGEIVRVLLQQTDPQVHSTAEFAKLGWTGVLWPPAAGGALGFSGLPAVTNLFWTFLFAGATVLIAYRIKRSSYGRAMLSVREDEIAAEAMGVNIARVKVRAFVLAAALAGIAGVLYAHQQGTNITPRDAGFQRSFEIVMMVVLGGLGSISGSVLAAIAITVISEWLRPLGEYRMILFALALIIMMIFRPGGLFGLREVWDLFTATKRQSGVATKGRIA